MSKGTSKTIARNKKAFHDYDITEKLEVGIALAGYEVKSIRQGHVNFRDSYVRSDGKELWLMGCYIKPYEQVSHVSIDPDRSRKLLAHKKQIQKLAGKVASKELVLVPLSMYFSRHLVKLEIGLGKPRKQFDKRRALKEKDAKRQADRGMRG